MMMDPTLSIQESESTSTMETNKDPQADASSIDKNIARIDDASSMSETNLNSGVAASSVAKNVANIDSASSTMEIYQDSMVVSSTVAKNVIRIDYSSSTTEEDQLSKAAVVVADNVPSVDSASSALETDLNSETAANIATKDIISSTIETDQGAKATACSVIENVTSIAGASFAMEIEPVSKVATVPETNKRPPGISNKQWKKMRYVELIWRRKEETRKKAKEVEKAKDPTPSPNTDSVSVAESGTAVVSASKSLPVDTTVGSTVAATVSVSKSQAVTDNEAANVEAFNPTNSSAGEPIKIVEAALKRPPGMPKNMWRKLKYLEHIRKCKEQDLRKCEEVAQEVTVEAINKGQAKDTTTPINTAASINTATSINTAALTNLKTKAVLDFSDDVDVDNLGNPSEPKIASANKWLKMKSEELKRKRIELLKPKELPTTRVQGGKPIDVRFKQDQTSVQSKALQDIDEKIKEVTANLAKHNNQSKLITSQTKTKQEKSNAINQKNQSKLSTTQDIMREMKAHMNKQNNQPKLNTIQDKNEVKANLMKQKKQPKLSKPQKEPQPLIPLLPSRQTSKMIQPHVMPPQVQITQKQRQAMMKNQVIHPIAPHAPSQYPAGIPRTFLMQQSVDLQRFHSPNPSSVGSPNWMTNPMQSTVPKSGQSQANSRHNPSSSHVPVTATSNQSWQNTTSISPIFVDITEDSNEAHNPPPVYSPSDMFTDSITIDDQEMCEDSEFPNAVPMPGQKRVSAFERLGPHNSAKKPKLTINLMLNKEKDVREVVDLSKEEEVKEVKKKMYVPVHLREEVTSSSDETVMKYLMYWPWKKSVSVKKTVTARPSKTAMMLEEEQMEEVYEKDNAFIAVSVTGYPATWKQEDVLDTLLDNLKGKSFIPCFIEFTDEECKFLVMRARAALLAIHKIGFVIRKDEVELSLTISQLYLNSNQLEFVPRLVIGKRLSLRYDDERKLDLKEFTLKPDVSNFIYFPLHRTSNQLELVQLQSTIAWDYLTDLNISHNRLTSIDGFNLALKTPKLKNLDLSYNHFDRITFLLSCRELALHSIKLEGNPLCNDYTDPRHYVRVVKMLFPTMTELDGIPIHLKGDLPSSKKNYCPEDAKPVVDKFLETFFPLLDSEDRTLMDDMYDEYATLTVTFRHNLRSSPLYRDFRNLFLRSRVLEVEDMECVEGVVCIVKLLCKWPSFLHDPYTFTVDVLHHNESTTIIRVGGVLKLTSDSLAEDEHLLAFTRTVVLGTSNGVEYRIYNEMVYWDEPDKEYAYTAFQISAIPNTKLSLKLESAPDDYLKEKLLDIFMELTDLDKKRSERCLTTKDWNLKHALEYFMNLLKLDSLDALKDSD